MSLRRNVIANYAGQGWTALVNLAFIPLYIHYLGMEAYGLIGLFAVLQAWLTLLDMGMTPALNREVARHGAGVGTAEAVQDLVHTFERICALLAVLIVVGLAVASSWIANKWLNTQTLPASEIARSLSIMGLVGALRFIEGLFRGAILGLQRHVWLNVVLSGFATLRAVGAVAVLAWIDQSIVAFFTWQAIVSAMTVAALYFGVHRYLPKAARRPRFSPGAFTSTWRFAGGVFVTTLLTLLLTQVDKILLSSLLSLESFGTYAFAATVAGSLFQVVGPIAQSYYPRLTELVASRDQERLIHTYHQGAQLMSIMMVPAGLILIVYGEPLLRAWTGDADLAHRAAVIVSILSVGTLLNGWMHIPYMLQLANGWSTLAAWTNFVAAIVIVPALLWVIPRYGAVGAASIWVTINAGYVLVAIHVMHTRLLRTEKLSWYVRDLAMPAAGAAIVVGISRTLQPSAMGNLGNVAWIGATGCLAFVASVLSTSQFRIRLLAFGRSMLSAV